MKAVVYARFSSNNQREESIDAQIRASEEYATRNGYNIVEVYADKAKSGTNTNKRPEFLRMMKDAEEGKFEIIIVHKLDRFSRDKYDSAMYKRKLKQANVTLKSVTEQLGGSPEDVILESVLEGMAEYYSKNLAREAMKGLKENAYKAMHTGGQPPLGYDVNSEKKYILNENEAKTVKLIYELYLKGISHKKIAQELNELGYTTKLGQKFKQNSISSILRNEKYTGVYIFNKSSSKDAYGKRNSHKKKSEGEIIRVEGGMPKIISKEDFQKVQEIMESRKKLGGANKAKENYLLTGIIKCGCCGKNYQGNRRHPKNKPLYISYRCSNRKATSSKDCTNKEINKVYIEEFVLSELEKNIFNDKAISHLAIRINENLKKKNESNNDKTQVLECELKEINMQIDNIINAISQGFMQQEFKDKLEELKERKTDLEIRLKELTSKDLTKHITENDVKILLKDFSGYVMTRNLPECKKFIRDFVKEVIIYKEQVEVIFNFNLLFNVPKNNDNELELTSKIAINELFLRYSNSFYIKVS